MLIGNWLMHAAEGWPVAHAPNGAGIAPPPAWTNRDELFAKHEAVSRFLRLGGFHEQPSTPPPLVEN